MKKIVALVLCLALALSLCTVAFAATTTVDVDAKGYSLLVKTTNADAGVTFGTKFSKTVTDNKVVTEGTKTTTTYYAAEYKIAGTSYYACDVSFADYKLVKDGVVVEYLSANNVLAAGTTLVATSYVEAKEKPACGEYSKNVYIVDGKAYEAGNVIAVYNGKMVGIAATPTTSKVPHDFTKKAATYNAKGEIVSLACDTCKASFTVVKTGKIPATYAGTVDATTLATEGYVVLMDSTAASTAVDSPKTFDAGIALYAGLALMSAAGSVAVIGKKKEF